MVTFKRASSSYSVGSMFSVGKIIDGDDERFGGNRQTERMSRISEGPEKAGGEPVRRKAFVRDQAAPELADYGQLLGIVGLPTTPLPERTWFCAIVGMEAMGNMILMGLEADYRCRRNCEPDSGFIWWLADLVVTSVFLLDMATTIVAYGPRVFVFGNLKSKPYNLNFMRLIDLVVVALRAVDTFAVANHGPQRLSLKHFSAIRVFHLGHLATKLQLIQTFRELWLILAGMPDTMRTVAWVVGFLVLTIYLFAIVATITVHDSERYFAFYMSEWGKEDYWGTVGRSMFTLFQMVTGDSWARNSVWPLVETYNIMIVLFVAFLCIASLALMNTIVGAVVESTLRSAGSNAEAQARERQKVDQRILSSLEMIFREADSDFSGELDKKELEAALMRPKVRKNMKLLGIPVGDLDLLFSLLDEDGTGSIKTDHFFRGCRRLRGPAMARDLQHMAVDFSRHIRAAKRVTEGLNKTNDCIATVLDLVDMVECDIIKDEKDNQDPVHMARKKRPRANKMSFLRTTHTKDVLEQNSDSGYQMSDNGSEQHPKTPPTFHPALSMFPRDVYVNRGRDWGSLRSAGSDQGNKPALQPEPPPIPQHLVAVTRKAPGRWSTLTLQQELDDGAVTPTPVPSEGS